MNITKINFVRVRQFIVSLLRAFFFYDDVVCPNSRSVTQLYVKLIIM